MPHPELTSLIGLRDSDGDRLILLRLDQPDGTRKYMLRVGTGSVSLTPEDLQGLRNVIRLELGPAGPFRFFTRAIGLVLLYALAKFFASDITGPLFAYPWSN